MEQTSKDLLLKDLCARLPYGVKCAEVYPDGNKFENEWDIIKISKYVEDSIHISNCKTIYGYCSSIENIKPYLFPLSSMTEEQFEELKDFAGLKYEGNTLELVEWDSTCDKTLEFWLEEIPSYCVIKVFDWLNKNHFDYRGLIPMGLAIDATGLNIY